MKLKLIPASLILALVVTAAAATSAAAASSTARSGSEAASSFCGVARGVARDIVNSTSISGSTTAADAKMTFEKIAAAEPALLASAPTRLKGDLRPVFGYLNLVIIDLKKVNWSTRGLVPYLPTLIPRAKAVQTPLHVLKVYFNTTCKLNV